MSQLYCILLTVHVSYLQFFGVFSSPTTTILHPGNEAMCMTSAVGGATVVITIQWLNSDRGLHEKQKYNLVIFPACFNHFFVLIKKKNKDLNQVQTECIGWLDSLSLKCALFFRWMKIWSFLSLQCRKSVPNTKSQHYFTIIHLLGVFYTVVIWAKNLTFNLIR